MDLAATLTRVPTQFTRNVTPKHFTPPYAPGWFDRLLDAVERLPGPTWAYLVAFLLVTFAYLQVVLWVNGTLEFPGIDFQRAFFIPFAPYVVAVWLYIRRVARNALEKFRPLLETDEETYARLEYQLTNLPAGPTLLMTALAVMVYIIFILYIPLSYYRQYAPSFEAVIYQFVWIQMPSVVFSALGIYRALYILREATRILRRATRIELYQASSLYAFSSLTAQIAVSLLAPAYYLFAIQQSLVMGNAPLLVLELSVIPVSIACFLLPLREMHNRIVREKASLLGEANRRFENLVQRVHHGVDTNEFQYMDNWNKALANLVIERDTLEKIPTWPWERGTLTGFLTALILPVVLWLITRLLERLV